MEPTKKPKCEHVWKYEDDEYGSLAGGGSYAIYRCKKCGKRDYVPLPD
jgi:hypothetical protein